MASSWAGFCAGLWLQRRWQVVFSCGNIPDPWISIQTTQLAFPWPRLPSPGGTPPPHPQIDRVHETLEEGNNLRN